MINTTKPKAFSAAPNNVSLPSLNFSASFSCLTKAFTTRAPIKFSCNVVLSLSTHFCIAWNLGFTFIRIVPTATARIGIVTKKIVASSKLIDAAKIHAKINIIGALTNSLIPIVAEF